MRVPELFLAAFLVGLPILAQEVEEVTPAQTQSDPRAELQELWQDVLDHRRQCFSNIEMASLQSDLSEGRQKVQEQKKVLSREASELSRKRETLEQERAMVDEKLEELKQKLSWQRKAAQKDIGTLAKLYETMDAQVAAQTFAGIPPVFVAGLIAEMKTESAAKILKHVPADKMRQYTLALATRNILQE